MVDDALKPLFEAVGDPARLGEWSRCTFARSQPDSGWSRRTATPVLLKGGPAVKVVDAVGRREEAKTVRLEDWPRHAEALFSEAFDRVHLRTRSADWHARRSRKGRWLVSRGKPSAPFGEIGSHDRERRYPLPAEDDRVRGLFVATGIFSPAGRLRREYSDKHRQVQHYVELLRPLPVWAAAREAGKPLRVLDAGAGKAYMSLALYLYGELNGVTVALTGLDSDPDVVEKARSLAAELGYERARFEATTIADFAAERRGEEVDLVVSLHACDTATDEAIAAGVELGADAIVVAPCCHRELAEQMGRDGDTWQAVLQHGVLRGRLADIVTDSMRASALEMFGYKAEVIEFVAAEHTAKNVMIRASRRRLGSAAKRAAERGRERYRSLASYWSVTPALERLLADRWPEKAA